MSNPSKAKGTRWEVRLRDHFRANGAPHCERLAQGGSQDRGDLTGLPGVVIEAKAYKQMHLAEWQDELRVEMRNADAPVGAVLIPRRNHPTANGYAVLPIDVFTLLLQQAGWLPESP